MIFKNRSEAGKKLASALHDYSGRQDAVVLALPRGGVPVGYEIAAALNIPLDILIVRKLGVPGHEELAMGAIASIGEIIINEDVVTSLGIRRAIIDSVAARERRELERREKAYRGARPEIEVKGKHVILVDDGLATGASMRAAVLALKLRQPLGITVAVPAAPPEVRDEFRKIVDEVICLITPQPFGAVGNWYVDFSQTTDEEVQELLVQAEGFRRPSEMRDIQEGALP